MGEEQEVKIGVMEGGHRIGFPLCSGRFVPYHSSDLWIVKDKGQDYDLTVEFCLNALRVDDNQIVFENFWLGSENHEEVVDVLRQLVFRVNQRNKEYVSIKPAKVVPPVPEKDKEATRQFLIGVLFYCLGLLTGYLIIQFTFF